MFHWGVACRDLYLHRGGQTKGMVRVMVQVRPYQHAKGNSIVFMVMVRVRVRIRVRVRAKG